MAGKVKCFKLPNYTSLLLELSLA